MAYKGFSLPYRITEFDEDSPIAVQRNFSEIEYYLNRLLRGVTDVEEQLNLLGSAPVSSEYEFPDEEVLDTRPTLNLMEYPLETTDRAGSIDLSVRTDENGGIFEVWVARVLNSRLVIEVHDAAGFATPDRTFSVATVGTGAEVVDTAIAFNGAINLYGIFVTEDSPHIFWVERSGDKDTIYTIVWDGTGAQPVATKLGEANLSLTGEAAQSTIDITV